MDYTIIKRNKNEYNSKWNMAKTSGQMYRSYSDALASAKRFATDLPSYEFMVCEMQTMVTSESVNVTDLRLKNVPETNNNKVWF